MLQVSGFSQKSTQEKIRWVMGHMAEAEGTPMNIETPSSNTNSNIYESFWHRDPKTQQIFEEISENAISNYYLPYCVAPNFLIDEKSYVVPMVIEESSVVAACSASAKYWAKRGGFTTEVVSTRKMGQVHFNWSGAPEKFGKYFAHIYPQLMEVSKKVGANMIERGGGVVHLSWRFLQEVPIYQLLVEFETCDAMGANYINTVLEAMMEVLQHGVGQYLEKIEYPKNLPWPEVEKLMAIVSNYNPHCLVKAHVRCKVGELDSGNELSSEKFAKRMVQACKLAKADIHRAVTHNKGIMNGIDAVTLACGNDFRAIEAQAHAYAARTGRYQGLTDAEILGGEFHFSIEIPITVGTVGGMTSLHPMAAHSLKMLGNPNIRQLMSIMACVGLAQNFGALKSLVTKGIQKGHMGLHLTNILRHLDASHEEKIVAREYFKDKVVSFSKVSEYIRHLRQERLH